MQTWTQTGHSKAGNFEAISLLLMSLSFKLHMAREALRTAAPGALGKDDAAQPDCPSLQIARPSRLEPGWNLLHLSPCNEAGDISTEGASVVGLGVISMQTRRNHISSSAGYSQNTGCFLNTIQVSGMRKVGPVMAFAEWLWSIRSMISSREKDQQIPASWKTPSWPWLEFKSKGW